MRPPSGVHAQDANPMFWQVTAFQAAGKRRTRLPMYRCSGARGSRVCGPRPDAKRYFPPSDTLPGNACRSSMRSRQDAAGTLVTSSAPKGRESILLCRSGRKYCEGMNSRAATSHPTVCSRACWLPDRSVQPKRDRHRHLHANRPAILSTRYEARLSNGAHRRLIQRTVHGLHYFKVSGDALFIHHEPY